MASQDPYFGVRDNVKAQCDKMKVKNKRFHDMLRSVNTASNLEFKDLRKALAKDVRGVEKQLRDLRGAIEMVENNRAKFPGISNPELGQRKVFVDDMTYIVTEIKKGMESQSVRQKLAKDETDARMAKQQSMKTSALPTDNTNEGFLRNQRQQTHQIIDQQDIALTDLGASVDRLGDMGRVINTELREQNQMLDELDDDIDEAGNKMNFVMAKLAKLLKTKDGCLIWTIVLLTLLLVILIALTIWT